MNPIPMYAPTGFEFSQATACGQLVDCAYDQYSQWKRQKEPNKKEFAWTPRGPALTYGNVLWGKASGFLWRETEPFGFVAWDDSDTTYLVLRGTQSGADWISNLRAELTRYTLVANYGRAHEGFFALYKSLRRQLLAELDSRPVRSRLMIFGHSMGSALTTLAIPDVIKNSAYKPTRARSLEHYNLAAPRSGNVRFARSYNSNQVTTYRVVNTEDLVPDVPPAVLGDDDYCHVGTPVDFTAQYGSLGDNHSSATSYLYALEHPAKPWKLPS
jgi:hypothetical protein